MCTITQYVTLRYWVVQSFRTDVRNRPITGEVTAVGGREPATNILASGVLIMPQGERGHH